MLSRGRIWANRFDFLPPNRFSAHILSDMHVCAWCDQQIGTHFGSLSGRPAANYGICSECLIPRLAELDPTLERRELTRARRMRGCGQSLAHIGHVLGVSQPVLQVALSAT